MKITNAQQTPKVYYGLHMVEGVAEYPEHKSPDGSPMRILVLENTLKEMDRSFVGKPVYVNHQEVDLQNIQEQADGYVIESFFNTLDGKHWAKFIVVSDRGHEAIKNGWRLSNAYTPRNTRSGGKWHAVEYAQEIVDGEYDHLAIVPNPRYAESVIMTPDEFKAYNASKQQQLNMLTNSKKEEKRPMLKFFKKAPIENAVDLETAVVTLKGGREVTIAQLVNEAEMADAEKKNSDEMEEKKNMAEPKAEPVMANVEHVVEVDGEKMSVGSLVEKYRSMKAKNTAPAEEEKKNTEVPAEGEKKNTEAPAEGEKQNSDEEEKKENEEQKDEKKENSYFDTLKNAADQHGGIVTIETLSDQVARGRSRYGSGK